MKKLSIMILMATSMLAACGDGNRTSPDDPGYISTHGEGEDVDEMVIDRTAVEDRAAYWTVDEGQIEATQESVRGNLDQMDQNINRIESDIQSAQADSPDAQNKMQEVQQQVSQAKQTLKEARQSYQANNYEEAAEMLKEANQTLEEAREKYLNATTGTMKVDMERESNPDAL